MLLQNAANFQKGFCTDLQQQVLRKSIHLILNPLDLLVTSKYRRASASEPNPGALTQRRAENIVALAVAEGVERSFPRI